MTMAARSLTITINAVPSYGDGRIFRRLDLDNGRRGDGGPAQTRRAAREPALHAAAAANSAAKASSTASTTDATDGPRNDEVSVVVGSAGPAALFFSATEAASATPTSITADADGNLTSRAPQSQPGLRQLRRRAHGGFLQYRRQSLLHGVQRRTGASPSHLKLDPNGVVTPLADSEMPERILPDAGRTRISPSSPGQPLFPRPQRRHRRRAGQGQRRRHDPLHRHQSGASISISPGAEWRLHRVRRQPLFRRA